MTKFSGITNIGGNLILWGLGPLGFRFIKQTRDGEIIEETVHFGVGTRAEHEITGIKRYQTVELFNLALKSTASENRRLKETISRSILEWFIQNRIIAEEFDLQREAFASFEYQDIHHIPLNLLEPEVLHREYHHWEQLKDIEKELTETFKACNLERENLPVLSETLSAYLTNDLDRVW